MTVYLCSTFSVLARLAVYAPVAFRVVRLPLAALVALTAVGQPMAGAMLLLPLVAASFISFPRFVGPDALGPDAA
ncbi:MAG TPA: hypothetical protein VM030_01860 [Acidimicrobiales bacterium]|nr:hypothetical protein [Acidimicrobiales bacterium]